MTIYYNSKSRTLKKLSLDQQIEIKEILSNTAALKTRKVDLKYRLQHGGKSLPIYSFQYGKGCERGKERVLYTHIDNKCVVLDHVTEHDYQKVTTMDRTFMRNWLAAFKSGTCDLVEICKDDSHVLDFPIFEPNEADMSLWLPASIDGSGQLLQPTQQQQHVAAGDKSYPLFIEGVAGSGKTLVLTLICHFLAQSQLSPATAEPAFPAVIYAYPNRATLLGAKMTMEWERLGLLNEESPEKQLFQSGEIDTFLPPALREERLAALKQWLREFIETKKKQLTSNVIAKKHNSPSSQEPLWQRFFEVGLSVDIIFEYLTTLVVFRSFHDLMALSLNAVISARGGLSSEIFRIIEELYAEVALRPGWKDLLEAFQSDATPYHMVMIDEAQNISFIALCYILKKTAEQKVIFSGDRNQANEWNSVSSLELLEIFLNRRRIAYQKEVFEKHYRCPQDIWLYAQNRVLPLKERFFGEGQSASRAAVLETEQKAAPSPRVSNLSYLKMTELKSVHLASFFAHIPELSPDCFVISQDLVAFENFSQQYLDNKRLILITPEQAAGLEVKTVIAFNPLHWRKVNQLVGRKKQKARSKNLSQDEQEVYEQLSHFYVTLTRSIEKVLILESGAGNGASLQQELFSDLQTLESLAPASYADFTPEALYEIYIKMGGGATKEGRDFYLRYQDHLESQVQNASAPVLLKTQVHAQVTTSAENQQGQPLGQIFTQMAATATPWERVTGLDRELMARLLFEPYGKKKKSYWERLLEQKADAKMSPTAETLLWKKFLASRVVGQHLDQPFYEQRCPGSDVSTGQWLLSSYPENNVHRTLTKELLEKTLESERVIPDGLLSILIDRYFIKQRSTGEADIASGGSAIIPVTFSTAEHKKRQFEQAGVRACSSEQEKNECSFILEPKHRGTQLKSAAIAPSWSKIDADNLKQWNAAPEKTEQDIETEKKIKLNLIKLLTGKREENLEEFSEQLPQALDEYFKYYRSLQRTGVEMRQSLESLVVRCLVPNPAFWAGLCATKYMALQKILCDENLFFGGKTITSSFLEKKSPEDLLLFDPGLLKKALSMMEAVYLKTMPGQDFVVATLGGIFLVLKSYSEKIDASQEHLSAPLMILLSRIAQPSYFDCLSPEIITRSLAMDTYWKRKSYEEIFQCIDRFAQEAIDYDYSIQLRQGLIDFVGHMRASSNHLSFFEQINNFELTECSSESGSCKGIIAPKTNSKRMT